MKRSKTLMGRSQMFMEFSQTFMERSCKRSGKGNGCNAERSGMPIVTFEPGRSNELERIVENAHVHASKTKERHLLPKAIFFPNLLILFFIKGSKIISSKKMG
jgi:hypothetical protein